MKSTILSDDELPGTSSEESNDCQSIIRQCEFKPNHLPYYQIVGDNIDFEVKTKFMTLEKKNRSLHWFNMVAVDERISPPQHLSNKYPRCSVLSIGETEFLPSEQDLQHIRADFIMLFARTIVTYLKDFSVLRFCVDFHLPHQYSKDTALKSLPVPLGIVEWNENKQTDMIEILKYVQRYIPYASEGPVVRLQLTGDLLTAERERAALRSLVDSSEATDRIEGILPHAEDFHCSMNFLDLIFSKFYKYNSGHNDSGTLLNLRTLLGRKNVTSDPIHNFTACNSFLEDVLDGHILAIAMHRSFWHDRL